MGVRRRYRTGTRPRPLSRILFALRCHRRPRLRGQDPHSQIELIGASGAVAGVVVGYVMLRPCAKITVLIGIIPLRISAYWVVGLFVVSQLWNLASASKSEVAYWCHFGGMLAGA